MCWSLVPKWLWHCQAGAPPPAPGTPWQGASLTSRIFPPLSCFTCLRITITTHKCPLHQSPQDCLPHQESAAPGMNLLEGSWHLALTWHPDGAQSAPRNSGNNPGWAPRTGLAPYWLLPTPFPQCHSALTSVTHPFSPAGPLKRPIFPPRPKNYNSTAQRKSQSLAERSCSPPLHQVPPLAPTNLPPMSLKQEAG